ncbi:regulatory protein RecX [Bdellovibrio bacteriovorus W]|nr:regulatory protein RecX [Bdellovibrio bacteriovorus W]
MSEKPIPSKTLLAMKKKVMDMIARRDHSEKELRSKLKEKFAEAENLSSLIDEAIEFAKDNNWLGDPQRLAERFADMLHRRNKGINFINNYLREKGLPSVGSDNDFELEKALELVKNKYRIDSDRKLSREEKAKVGRFLVARGFDSGTVRKVIYEKL